MRSASPHTSRYVPTRRSSTGTTSYNRQTYQVGPCQTVLMEASTRSYAGIGTR